MHSAHKLNTQLAKQTSKAELHFLHSTTPIYPQTNLSFSLLPCSFSLYNSISSSILWSMQVLSRRFSTLSAFPLSSILSLLPSHCSNFACISSNPSFFVFCFFLGDSDSEVASVFARLNFVFGWQFWISNPFARAFF